MRKTLIAMAVLGAAGLLMAAGRPGVVRLKDGSVYEGNIDEKSDVVTVDVRGILSDIPRERIASIAYGDFETRWKEAYAKLDEKDAKGRVAAARRAFDEHRYDLAETAARDAQRVDPNSTEAAEILKLTINQRRLETATGTGNPTNPPANPNGEGNPPAKLANTYKLLTTEQINRVKQVELKENESVARFNLKNNVTKRYHDADSKINMSYSEFLKQPQGVKAQMIIQNGGPELAKDVEVTNDPAVMQEFRRETLGLILNGCATSGCHGGNNEAAKAFPMVAPAPDVATSYSNFYQLSTWQKKQAKNVSEVLIGGTNLPMIDRVHPEASLLLQYGLPEGQADQKHPASQGFKPMFTRGKDDPKYKKILSFVDSLRKIEPDYGFTYTLEREGAGLTVPTTQQVNDAVKGAGESVKDAADKLRELAK